MILSRRLRSLINKETRSMREVPLPTQLAVVVYGREGCPMCSDAKQWLVERKIVFTFREVFQPSGIE